MSRTDDQHIKDDNTETCEYIC